MYGRTNVNFSDTFEYLLFQRWSIGLYFEKFDDFVNFLTNIDEEQPMTNLFTFLLLLILYCILSCY